MCSGGGCLINPSGGGGGCGCVNLAMGFTLIWGVRATVVSVSWGGIVVGLAVAGADGVAAADVDDDATGVGGGGGSVIIVVTATTVAVVVWSAGCDAEIVVTPVLVALLLDGADDAVEDVLTVIVLSDVVDVRSMAGRAVGWLGFAVAAVAASVCGAADVVDAGAVVEPAAELVVAAILWCWC